MPLVDWLERHEDFARVVHALRCGLAERDSHRWYAALDPLANALGVHMAFEESVLLPVWETLRADAPPNASARVFLRDHALIREHLVALGPQAAALGHPTPPDAAFASPAAVLARSEHLWRLQGVLEHHDAREAKWLNPGLDQACSSAEVQRWCAAIATLQDDPGTPLSPQEGPPAQDDANWSPIDRLLLMAAQDGPVAQAFARVPVPGHPKGPARHARVARAVAEVSQAPTLVKRREALVRLVDEAYVLRVLLG